MMRPSWLDVCGSASVFMLILAAGSAQLLQNGDGSPGFNIPSIQEGNDAVVSTVNQIFGALRLPINVRNPFRRASSERAASGIGSSCRTTVECVAQSPNSVCYDGRCLCNLGYHYVARADQCIKDNTCPVCDNPVNTCLGGQDVYCNGSCFADYRTESAEKAKKQIYSPNWPKDYSAETDKFICVQANTGKRVHLDLIWIDLETGCGHSCDYVKVYDGCVANDSSNLLAFYTGDNAGNRQQVTSNCNKMMIHFHSDKDDGGAEARAKRQVTADEANPDGAETTLGAETTFGAETTVRAKASAAAAKRADPAPTTAAPAEFETEQPPKNLEKYLQKQEAEAGKTIGDDYSKDQRSGFMGYYREIDYDEKVCACANP